MSIPVFWLRTFYVEFRWSPDEVHLESRYIEYKYANSSIFQVHQENSIRLARLAPDMPDATSVPYYVWRHIDARDAIKVSQLTYCF
jgi:hypothetical protein